MFLLHLHRRPRMGVAVILCRETQNKCRDNKSDNAFLFGRENEPVSEFVPIPTFEKFQRASCFTRGRTRTDG
jgi:hypothetical protein